MIKKVLFSSLLACLLSSCFQPERNCTDFKTGAFSFTTTLNGEEKTTTFTRTENTQIEIFEQQRDTSSIRWINDCEYIVKNLHPKNSAEEQPIHIKILSTTANSYTFEYSIVGESKKSRGTAIKTN
ncbi:DNA topoisomerase IV [Spongiimicrobium salis]|uniref:DNA topoisomerase IV n=1 Tax=Spongiimicrobium salis TaxID=1667022 RepID=UPI00374DB37C